MLTCTVVFWDSCFFKMSLAALSITTYPKLLQRPNNLEKEIMVIASLNHFLTHTEDVHTKSQYNFSIVEHDLGKESLMLKCLFVLWELLIAILTLTLKKPTFTVSCNDRVRVYTVSLIHCEQLWSLDVKKLKIHLLFKRYVGMIIFVMSNK